VTLPDYLARKKHSTMRNRHPSAKPASLWRRCASYLQRLVTPGIQSRSNAVPSIATFAGSPSSKAAYAGSPRLSDDCSLTEAWDGWKGRNRGDIGAIGAATVPVSIAKETIESLVPSPSRGDSDRSVPFTDIGVGCPSLESRRTSVQGVQVGHGLLVLQTRCC